MKIPLISERKILIRVLGREDLQKEEWLIRSTELDGWKFKSRDREKSLFVYVFIRAEEKTNEEWYIVFKDIVTEAADRLGPFKTKQEARDVYFDWAQRRIQNEQPVQFIKIECHGTTTEHPRFDKIAGNSPEIIGCEEIQAGEIDGVVVDAKTLSAEEILIQESAASVDDDAYSLQELQRAASQIGHRINRLLDRQDPQRHERQWQEDTREIW